MKLTVFYEAPFWVGIVELEEDGRIRAGRHIFGAEPSSQEIWEFVLSGLERVMDGLSCEVQAERRPLAGNPKRRAREAARESRGKGAGSASHEAVRLELEKHKRESSRQSRECREALAEHKRELARQKAKNRHRGR
ncbi:YjdF family protein [Paenibacillus sp. HN-1]|uniref:YjdF family protein n=1 Tax=Paenibacillus TaxID=44249 RepID=UPI001CA83DCA|nr:MULTISPECIES: YjdF family protein [Paenibacillus]MBY9077709.1 YjdF family protein [Paenibacillus sp. CGMCC 1.18879]MBY9083712.1 YjdF family protein [Paenibacillus sinensis]